MQIMITPKSGGTISITRNPRPSITVSPKIGVAPSRKLIAGTGLDGGGDLSADRTIGLSAASQSSLGKADSAIQPTATDASGFGFFLDQDDLTDDDATKAASQQSIKANIDARSPRGRFGTVALMLADTDFGYSASRFAVATGDQFEAGGFRYEVAASGASDHHLATAGGVKLYALDWQNPLAVGALADNDGTAGNGNDDTEAFHSTMDFGKGAGSPVHVTDGVYRVTDGYTNATLRGNVAIRGDMRTTTDDASVKGSIVELDSTDPASFFYSGTAGHSFEARDVRFRAAQYALDRKFWRSSVTSVNFRFKDVAFDYVEKPIVLEAGSYTQMSALRDVMFNDSGTIYTEHVETDGNIASLAGTLIRLDNVSHDGDVPANSAKKVMDLHGLRHVQSTNLLLEGTLPSSGWTVLKVGSAYDQNWKRMPVANFVGFWSEWTSTQPSYVIEQTGGRVSFSWCNLGLSTTSKYKLANGGVAHLSDLAFTPANVVNDCFELEDFKSNVIVERATMFLVRWDDERFTFRDCNYVLNSTTASEGVASVVASNTQSALIWKWDGGYLDGSLAALTFSAGTTAKLDTDATYGRKLSIVPSGNTILAFVNIAPREVVQNTQLWMTATVKLPTFTSGQMALQLHESGTVVSGGSGYDTTYSGQIVTLTVPWRIRAASPTNFGLKLSTISAGGVSGNMEVLALAFYMGNSAPRREYSSYPKNIVTWASAAPTAGSFVAGDVVRNSAPAAGGPEGWICVTTGSPGTWAAFGNIRLENTATYDPPSIAAGALDTTQTMTLTGAALGDIVDVSFSVALAGARLEAWVSASNTVSYRFSNPTGSAIDLGSGTVKARVRK